ncbi:hypothetical protein F5884DRAFT_3826 [Xylogone sp. PMI_703]|nr:hypothetical protein F5884DRAFT_3826 [Xylogone sp. PMI_703]
MSEKFAQNTSSSYTYAPAYSPFRTSFASISLHRSDRLRLLQFPQQDIDALRNVIKTSWHRGIQAEQQYAMSHEFKLLGNPWWGQTSDAIPARILMRSIFAYLYSVGWILHCSTDVSKKVCDKDTLLFRKQQSPPPPSEWISISFNHYDRLRLIGADPVLIAAFKTLLSSIRPLQDEGWKDKARNAFEFKIKGYPWLATGEETMSTRLLVLKMLETLEQHGWSLYASIDQNEASEDSSETDSWYCVRQKGWVEGSAVFHR